jgi:hypothetical protein
VWEELLPGMDDAPVGPDAAARRELEDRLQSLSYPAAESSQMGDLAKWSGRVWHVAENPAGIRTLAFRFAEDGAELELGFADGSQRLRIGRGEWLTGSLHIVGLALPVAACGRWIRRNVYEIELRFLEQAFHDRLTCHFVDNRLRVSMARNVWITPGLSDALLMPELYAESK